MGKANRQRREENRRRRLEKERAARKRAIQWRLALAGVGLLAAGLVAAVIVLTQPETVEDPPTTTLPEPVEVSEDTEPAADPAPEESEDVSQDAGAEPDPVSSTEPAVPDDCPAPDGTSGRRIDFDAPQPDCIDPQARYTAVFDTSEGEMRFELTAGLTPLTVNNFVTLARWGYYDGTLLFRTDPSIDIIQGGSPHTNSPSDPGPGYTIPDEPPFATDPDTGSPVGPYRYEPGQLVMARSAGFDSAGAQFFITTGPNAALLNSQGTYVVFGQTDQAGLEVAQSIIGLHVAGGNLGGAPSRDVVVHAVRIEETPSSG